MAKGEANAAYQVLSAELDEVLASLQSPDITIDNAMALYERGLRLVEQLEGRIKVAENKITQLKLQAAGGDEG